MGTETGSEDSKPTPQPTQPTDSNRYIHSDIYERLVNDDEDLIGLVAYGLYQVEKRRWIEQFNAERGTLPSEKEVKEFCFTYDDKRLVKLTSESQELIFRVTEGRIEERIEDLARDAFNVRAVQELSGVHSSISKISGYRHHVIGHLAGFAVLVGLYAFIVFAVKYEPTIASVAKW